MALLLDDVMTDVLQSVEYFKKKAKALLHGFNDYSMADIERVNAVLSDPSEITLMRAQHVIAVEHGFEKWVDLLEAQPIQRQLAITMRQHPTLNSFGFGAYAPHSKTAQERSDFIAGNRRELRNHSHRVEAILEWLKTNSIAPSKSIWSRRSSYGLKHDVEQVIDYITNGEFIAACIIAGFAFKMEGPNAYFAISEKSWEKALLSQKYPNAFREADDQSFFRYVLARKITNTPAGDLTTDIRSDRGFPSIKSWAELKSYLESVSGYRSEVTEAGRQVWRGYQSWLKKSPSM